MLIITGRQTHFLPESVLKLLLFFGSLLTMAEPSVALAGAFTPTLTQYAHTSWRVRDGDISGQPNAIAQTRDGYLWIGTEGGLVFYDGLRLHDYPLPSDGPVFAVEAAPEGGLWVGRMNSVLHIHDGFIASVPVGVGRFNDFYEDAAGKTWVARSRGPQHSGGLCQINESTLTCFGPAQQQPCTFGNAIAQSASGDFWIGSRAGACRWQTRDGAFFGKQIAGPQSSGVAAFLAEPDGSMLVGFLRFGQTLGLQRETAADMRPFSAPGLNGEDLQVAALLRDRAGALWIGTADKGIYHVDHDKVDRFSSSDGLSSDAVIALFEDHEGNVWVATAGGIDRLHRRVVSQISIREGLAAGRVSSVLARADGSVLIGTDDGLDIMRDGVFQHIGAGQGLPGHAIASILDDHTGNIWIGVDDGLALYNGGTFRAILKPDGSHLGVVVGLARDDRGDIWAITTGRPYRLYRVRNSHYFDEVHLPGDQNPGSITANHDGELFISTSDGKLLAYRHGNYNSISTPGISARQFLVSVLNNNDLFLFGAGGAYYLSNGRSLRLDHTRGFPCDKFSSVTEVSHDTVWLRGQCGMMIADISDFTRALDHPNEQLKLRLLDATDGAQPGEPSFVPAVTQSTDGRLWFATDGLLLTVDPSHIPLNTLPPPVHVEQVIADHRIYAAEKSITFPPRTRDVEIDYAGLSFVVPKKMHFRYRLTGLDDVWQDVGNRRAAFYMNLKPGNYRFQVIASNNDGIWNTTSESLDFSIRPAFYEMLWFKVFAGAVVCSLLWTAYSLRLRQLASEIRGRSEERVSERERIARELHDTLLQGFQGLVMRFQALSEQVDTSHPARRQMEIALDTADEVLDEGRRRVLDLRTGSSTDLSDAFASAGHKLMAGSKVKFNLVIEGKARAVHPAVHEEVVRIGEEALINAVKHGHPNSVEVLIGFYTHKIELQFRDDGIGINHKDSSNDSQKYHFGMTGMRERARKVQAQFVIRSRPGAGTEIILSVPAFVAYIKPAGRWSMFRWRAGHLEV